jgi:hypothetical protein
MRRPRNTHLVYLPHLALQLQVQHFQRHQLQLHGAQHLCSTGNPSSRCVYLAHQTSAAPPTPPPPAHSPASGHSVSSYGGVRSHGHGDVGCVDVALVAALHCQRPHSRPTAGAPPAWRLLGNSYLLGKALAKTVSERIGSLVGELLSEVGQRQAKQQRQIREFQNEVQERARTSAIRAAQKALATKDTVSTAAATQFSQYPRKGVRGP